MFVRARRLPLTRRVAVLLAALSTVLVAGLVGALAVSCRAGDASPRVTQVGPTGSAADPHDAITIRFAGNVDRKRIDAGLRLVPPVAGTLSWSGPNLRFTPQSPGLTPGRRYQVELGDRRHQLSRWSFTTSDALAVQFTSPGDRDAEVDPEAIVMVQFNRPVAPLAALGQSASGGVQNVLRFDPPLSGTGTWLTSALYRFQPDRRLHGSTTYTVHVPHDLTNLPDGTLPADYSFSFTTVLPAVGDQFPRDNTQFVDPGAAVRMLFNQPMDRASAEAAFSLVAAGSGDKAGGSFSWEDDQTLLFQPATPLPRGTEFAAVVAAGAQNRNGTGQSAQPHSWRFTVAPAPAVAKTEPANGASDAAPFGLTLTFTTPMDHDSSEAAVSIEPAPDTDSQPAFFWGPDTQLRVNYSFAPSSSYRLTVGAGAQDRYGEALAAPYTVAFSTAQRPPAASVVSGSFGAAQGTLDAGSPPVVFVATTNLSEVSLALSTISADDFRALVADPKQRDSYVPPDGALRNWTLPVPDQKLNETQVTPVDLAEDLPSGPLQPCFYLLDVAAAGLQRNRTVLEVTHTNLVLKRGVDSAFVWAADLSTGQPATGARVTLRDTDGNLLGEGTTDADGTFAASIPKPPPNKGNTPIFAAVERPGDAALASDNWWGSASPFSFGLPAALGPGSGLRAYLYSDRPIYRAGETAHLRLVLRTDDDGRYGLPSNTSGLSLEVLDPRGHAAASFPVRLDEFGTMGADFQVPSNGLTGNCTVNLVRSTQYIGGSGFLVAEFRTPEFQVQIKTDQSEYVNGATIAADAQADLFFGAPLAGAAVSWQVNASPYTFRPPGAAYAGYSFIDSDLVAAQRLAPKPVGSGSGTTDSSGHVAFSLPAQLGDFPTSEIFTVSATVTDANQQQVSASTSVIVHKAALFAGVKPRQYVTGAAGRSGLTS